MQLVIFDLDGTITWRDSLLPYVAGFLRRNPRYCQRLWRVPGALLHFLIDGQDRGRLKEALIRGLLHGVERQALEAWTAIFVERLVASRCRPQALEQIRLHRGEQHRLILLSASPDLYVTSIGERLMFDESIATGVRWNGDRLDGHLTTDNRRGEEKARVLEGLRSRYPGLRVVAYGNSASDFPHLLLAEEGWCVTESSSLARRAAELGLKTVAWA
ncbi:MAG TPA: HAD-IB family phosphatase [Steroidobacteraceae bacterium]|nr:HAD-IB family phosphatase [Steroidobacteraceae bacterium]